MLTATLLKQQKKKFLAMDIILGRKPMYVDTDLAHWCRKGVLFRDIKKMNSCRNLVQNSSGRLKRHQQKEKVNNMVYVGAYHHNCG